MDVVVVVVVVSVTLCWNWMLPFQDYGTEVCGWDPRITKSLWSYKELWLSSGTVALLLCVGSTDCKKCPEFCAEQPDAKRHLLLLWQTVWGIYSTLSVSSLFVDLQCL